jgi:hypothetical protein
MHIDGTKFGSITIDGQTYSNDIYILPRGEIQKRDKKNSPRVGGHRSLGISEVKYILSFNPKVIIIGKGQSGVLPYESGVFDLLNNANIQVFEDTTPNIIKKFNLIFSEKDEIAAIFHTTC